MKNVKKHPYQKVRNIVYGGLIALLASIKVLSASCNATCYKVWCIYIVHLIKILEYVSKFYHQEVMLSPTLEWRRTLLTPC
jgi:hypothetical protein